MRRMSQLGRILAGGGLIAGAFGLLSLFTKATFAIETLKEFKEAFNIYTRYVRVPISKVIGFDAIPFAPYALDVLVLWLALFLAINAFVQRFDGLFVWGHISRAYCYKAKPTLTAQARCTLPKYMFAILATPIVCLAAIWSSAATGQTMITMAYMTIEPKAVARYLSAFFIIPALIIVVSSLLSA